MKDKKKKGAGFRHQSLRRRGFESHRCQVNGFVFNERISRNVKITLVQRKSVVNVY